MKEGEEEAPNQSSSLGLSRSGKSPMYITQSQLELLVATPQIGERTDTELCLDDSGISSLDTLPPNLRKLSCRRNRLSYVVGLPAKLEYLDLTENRVSSLEGIERCAGLQTLLLGSNALAQCDLSGLTELKVPLQQTTFAPVEIESTRPERERTARRRADQTAAKHETHRVSVSRPEQAACLDRRRGDPRTAGTPAGREPNL